MSETAENHLEKILRLIAASDPEPWNLRAHARQARLEVESLEDLVEWLHIEKLVEHRRDQGGPAFVLSPLGRRVLEEPDLLERLRSGQPIVPDDPGAIVRHSLYRPLRPIVSRLLLLANIAVFAYGYYLAGNNAPLRQVYLKNFGAIPPHLGIPFLNLLHEIGSLTVMDWLRGDWWRLLTTCFVHGGLLHLGANMFMLYGAGAFVEQTWGRLRMLIIYALSGWGGSALAVAYTIDGTKPLQDIPIVGASGALCGLIGAHAVWVLLYGRYLPRHLARRGRSRLLLTLVLIVGISMIPGVSGWGHLGGGIAGAVAGLVLHFQRFGPGVLRWLAIPVLFTLPWPWLLVIQHQQATSPAWHKMEYRLFLEKHPPRELSRALQSVATEYEEQVDPLYRLHPTRRDPAAVEKALGWLADQQANLDRLEEPFQQSGPYRGEAAREAQQLALDVIEAQRAWLREAAVFLTEKKRTSAARNRALRKADDRAILQRDAWEKLSAPDQPR